MTTLPHWPSTAASRRAVVPDVVVGLLNDASATAVARAAVREAVSRGARIRFVQVVRAGLTAEERASSDGATFSAALRALREAPRVPVTFEVVEGDAAATFVDRSGRASVLVVGRDDEGASNGAVASYCQQHARCDVLTVAAER